MPPSTSQDKALPAGAPRWFAFAAGQARSIRKRIERDATPSGQDWTASSRTAPKSRLKSRRPVFE